MRRSLVAAWLALGAAACGTTRVLVPPRGPDEATAVVYLIRKSFPPYVWGCEVAIDGRPVASIANNDFVAVDVPIGRHHVMVDVTQGPDFPFDLEVEPNETHYVVLTGAVLPGHDQSSAGPSTYVLEWQRRAYAVTAEEGQALLASLRPAKAAAQARPAAAPPAAAEPAEPHVQLSESPPEVALSPNVTGIGHPSWEAGLELGLAGGGEELIMTTLSDGSTEHLNAGTGATIYAQAAKAWTLPGNDNLLFTGVAGGVKGWSIGGEGTDYGIQLLRFPVIPFVRYTHGPRPGFQPYLAAGAHIEFAPQLSGSGAAADVQHQFQTAYGWMTEAGLLVSSGADFTLGLRYTHLGYTTAGLPFTIDASSLGVTLGMQFTSLARDPAR